MSREVCWTRWEELLFLFLVSLVGSSVGSLGGMGGGQVFLLRTPPF